MVYAFRWTWSTCAFHHLFRHAVPGFRAVVLPAETAKRPELEWQGAVLPVEHALDPFNAPRRWIIKREQFPENILHFIRSQELLYRAFIRRKVSASEQRKQVVKDKILEIYDAIE